jgi:hypothetical protein
MTAVSNKTKYASVSSQTSGGEQLRGWLFAVKCEFIISISVPRPTSYFMFAKHLAKGKTLSVVKMASSKIGDYSLSSIEDVDILRTAMMESEMEG